MPLKISRHTSYCSKYWPRTSRCCRASFCDALAPFFSVEYYLISCYAQHYYSVPSPLTSDTMMRQWRCSFYAQDYCVYLSVCGSRPHILMVMVFWNGPVWHFAGPFYTNLCLPLFSHLFCYSRHSPPPTHLKQDDDTSLFTAHRQPLFFHLITAAATTLHHHHPPLHIIIAAHHYWQYSSIIYRAITIIIHCRYKSIII